MIRAVVAFNNKRAAMQLVMYSCAQLIVCAVLRASILRFGCVPNGDRNPTDLLNAGDKIDLVKIPKDVDSQVDGIDSRLGSGARFNVRTTLYCSRRPHLDGARFERQSATFHVISCSCRTIAPAKCGLT